MYGVLTLLHSCPEPHSVCLLATERRFVEGDNFLRWLPFKKKKYVFELGLVDAGEYAAVEP